MSIMYNVFDKIFHGAVHLDDFKGAWDAGKATGNLINHDGKADVNSGVVVDEVLSLFNVFSGGYFWLDILGYAGIDVPSPAEITRRTHMESWERFIKGLTDYKKQNDSQPGIGPSVPGGNPGGGQGGGNPGNPGGSPDGGNSGCSPDGGGNPGKQKPKTGPGGSGGLPEQGRAFA